MAAAVATVAAVVVAWPADWARMLGNVAFLLGKWTIGVLS